jgi:hypothetical protein
MSEYKLRKTADGDIRSCDRCGTEDVETAEMDWGPPFTATHEHPKELMCRFCYETSFGAIFNSRSECSVISLALALIQSMHILYEQGERNAKTKTRAG